MSSAAIKSWIYYSVQSMFFLFAFLITLEFAIDVSGPRVLYTTVAFLAVGCVSFLTGLLCRWAAIYWLLNNIFGGFLHRVAAVFFTKNEPDAKRVRFFSNLYHLAAYQMYEYWKHSNTTHSLNYIEINNKIIQILKDAIGEINGEIEAFLPPPPPATEVQD